jgi:CDP-4-dehydro-6-deoxyglucose reductase, E3
MSYQVTLQPSQHTFSTDAETRLLDAALAAGFNLPYGCRNGACGSCKGKVLSGTVDYGTHQAAKLTDAEKVQGFALFCCATARSDLVLECREVGGMKDIAIRTLPTRVHKIERVAPDVIVLSLKLPANERLQYLAGQYIDFLLRDGKRRSFSIANAPHDDEFLQLHVREVPGGHFTGHVFNTMKERDILRFEGPLGSFFLREDVRRPVVMVAGGTGFAPIKAVIEHAIETGYAQPVTLYWGARRKCDLYMHELAAGWTQRLPGFRYIPVLSEPAPEDAWDGRTGLVHDAVMADLADLSGHQVYACGGPAMIDAAKEDFTRRCNLPIEHFHADSFTYSSQ